MKNLISKTYFIVLASLSLLLLISSCVQGANKESNDIAKFKTRALWVDPPGFANRAAVDTMIEKCQRAGINTILANIMLRENVYFKSKNFVGNVNANDQFDPLAYVIEKAHAVNIKVQAWSCVYYSKPKSADWVMKPFIDKNYDHVYLSPAHPEVNPYLLSVMKELLDYDIDGIHLDYTRYWNAAFDYSDVARSEFKKVYDFDPQDFVDHPEKIVPADKDNFPVRVLCPNTIAEKVWEMGIIERTMNLTDLGYAYVTEDPVNIDKLKAPGILIVSHYTDVSTKMIDAFDRYIKRGGDIVWINPSGGLFSKYTKLASMSGVTATNNYLQGHQTVQSVKESKLSNIFSSVKINTANNSLVLGDANAVATFSDGQPSISINKKDKGSFMTIGFHLMSSDKQPITDLLKNIVVLFRSESGLDGSDLMAEKRKQWIDWRASHTLDLVREVNKMVKEKDPKLEVTSAAGLDPQELEGIYREGNKWLKDDLCDFLYPMNYRDNIDDFREVIENQISYTPDNTSNRIFPGLQLYIKSGDGFGPISAEVVKQQLELVKEYGYEGFCLFAYSYLSDEIIEVVSSYNNE